jgi:RNA polymerase sigma factor (sigma-70 family)
MIARGVLLAVMMSLGPDIGQSPGVAGTSNRDELLRHLDAAYDLARWLCGNEPDARDIVQESYLRAFRFIAQCRDANFRPWLLQIVRNTCHTWRRQNRTRAGRDEMLNDVSATETLSPPAALQQREDVTAVRRAIEKLPDEFREVVVLRELEGLAYKEIAAVTQVPLGTVMSRLSRARERLKELLADRREVPNEL